MINRERMIAHVESLIRIDSESRQEKNIAVKLKADLEALDAHVFIDDAHRAVNGSTGNIIASVKGGQPDAPPLLLSAHMDTVVPGKGVKPVRGAKSIKTSGDTVLGGDDKSGLSIIIEVLRALKEKKAPHGDLEIVFTVCEEIGLLGAKAVDPKRLKAKDGLVLDSEEASILTVQGPAAVRMEINVEGREAHAGVAPERGISAIQIASRAIAGMKLGRIDKETTANIGVIQGGVATNIIPKFVLLKGEARSLKVPKLRNQVRHMKKCADDSAKKYHGKCRVTVDDDYAPLNLSGNARIVRLARTAAKKLKYRLREGATGGGSDANVYNRWGIKTANLGTGMRDIHTVKEWLDLDDFERAANLLMEIILANNAPD